MRALIRDVDGALAETTSHLCTRIDNTCVVSCCSGIGFCGVDFKSGGKTLRNGRAKGFSVACSIGAVTTWPICGSSTTPSEKSRGPGYSIGELAPRLAAPDPGLA